MDIKDIQSWCELWLKTMRGETLTQTELVDRERLSKPKAQRSAARVAPTIPMQQIIIRGTDGKKVLGRIPDMKPKPGSAEEYSRHHYVGHIRAS